METIRYTLQIMILIFITAIASDADIRTKKIPNKLCLAGIIGGLCLSSSLYEVGLKLAAIVFLFFFGMLKLMGNGDIKLWMAISSIVGFSTSCHIILIASISLILYAIIINKDLPLFILSLKSLLLTRRINIIEQKKYAFAPFIFFASIVKIVVSLTYGGIL